MTSHLPSSDEEDVVRNTATVAVVALVALSAGVLVGRATSGGVGPPVPREDADDPDSGGDGDGSAPTALPEDTELAGALTGFGSCDELLTHLQDEAVELVGPYGLRTGPIPLPMAGRAGAMESEAMTDSGAGQAAEGAPGADTSQPSGPDAVGSSATGTNVQEAGVDEPDIAKLAPDDDGNEVLYTVTGQELVSYDVAGDTPRRLASLDLGVPGAQLLLDGDRLLVTSAADRRVEPLEGATAEDGALIPIGAVTPTSTLRIVDVADPTAPEVVERLTVDGATLSSRLVEGTARTVVRAEPVALPFVRPTGGGLRAEREATEANREVVRDSEIEDWLPYAIHETVGGTTTEGSLLPCDQVGRPDDFSGLGTVSVLTLDLADGLGLDLGDPADAPAGAGSVTGVLGGGQTVAASTERLYVSTTRWVEPGGDGTRPADAGPASTELHAFDTSEPGATSYTASGSVEGTLLSQFSLSEHDGRLRVASTVGGRGAGGPRGEASESRVTVLAEDDGELVEVGMVDGLGKGEDIQSVRFAGELGYVVTFRQIDPLYVLDLSEPTEPTVEGELKIPGFSSYLHPLGDGLLLGVGQDADPETGRTRGGQLSLFDVGDPTDPQRLDTLGLGEGNSEVGGDHRAFLHHPETGLSVVPFVRWGGGSSEGAKPRSGAVAATATDGELERAGRLDHRELTPDDGDDGPAASGRLVYEGRIRRSLVVDDRLVTVSELGVVTHDLESLEVLGSARSS